VQKGGERERRKREGKEKGGLYFTTIRDILVTK
jgi:hypothetical protein